MAYNGRLMTDPAPDIAPNLDHPEGLRIDNADPARLVAAIEAAFDYRGDVTIERGNGADPVSGYVFDRDNPHDFDHATLRLLPADGGPRVTIPYREVEALAFTGRDTAAGKSFETWMKKYVEKKLAGQAANIEAELPVDG